MVPNDSKASILIIDDEKNNVEILARDLEDLNYNILRAYDGEEGWIELMKHKEDIQVILLDRMMPNVDGIQFMKQLKADETVSKIPVIMQTAAIERSEINEGIKAGVYYYLTKPYDFDTMLAIVKSAIKDYNDYQSLINDFRRFKSKINIVKESYFEIQTLDEVRYLSTFLSNFYPNGEDVIFGISELLINAVEHGNLAISYDKKTELLASNSWEAEVERMLKLPEYKDKRVLAHFKRDDNCIKLTIEDEGDGFNWKEFIDISHERLTSSHGRGIALTKIMCFGELIYNDKGNKVTCVTPL